MLKLFANSFCTYATAIAADSYISLINDVKTVKKRAKKISCHQQDVVPQPLIDHFVAMISPRLLENVDSEMAYHCAYSLPAVALTLGSKNWGVLKETVARLAGFQQYKVRKTVACSLHELAYILGPEVASVSLIPIFEAFLKDVDEVRIGILKHLADFLKVIFICTSQCSFLH